MAQDNRSLGQFKLEGIRQMTRGVPQIEVTFDIDANGILKVSAKDQETGKEQTITITGSSGLEQSEIDRMIQDGEMNAAEDKKRREEAEVRNEADSLIYQAERQLNDLNGQVQDDDKTKIEQMQNDLRKALQENAPLDRLRSLIESLKQTVYSLSQTAYQQADTGTASKAKAKADDDVVDVDFEENTNA